MIKKLVATLVLILGCIGANATEYYTEQFDAYSYSFDLNGLSLTYTPDGSTNFYSIAATNITELPVDTTGYPGIYTGGDGIVPIYIQDPKTVKIYGTPYTRFYLSGDGYLMFNAIVKDWTPTIAEHFAYQRIALFWTDLYSPAGGTISAVQLNDRMVVTYDHVRFAYSGYYCTAQCELYFDGRIRMSWLDCDNWNGGYNIIVGLSDGNGTPGDFSETDLSDFPFDQDQDGLPDAWEIYYYGNIAWCLPEEDWFDEDGYDNMSEYIAGTDPADPNSYFQTTSSASGGSQMAINWNAVEGRKYKVWYKNTLVSGSYTAVPGYLNYPTSNYVFNATLDQRYYKVSVEMQ